MSVRPNIGEKGGQEYPVLKGIQTFLSQMAEGSARPAPMVLKELLQNADDAGATEVSVMLDQRTPRKDLSAEYATLCEPALLVRNNSHFRLGNEAGEEHDDFKAIRDVAGGHKRALATAAGRFGIGFNSEPSVRMRERSDGRRVESVANENHAPPANLIQSLASRSAQTPPPA